MPRGSKIISLSDQFNKAGWQAGSGRDAVALRLGKLRFVISFKLSPLQIAAVMDCVGCLIEKRKAFRACN
jgi:hypothetical protein